MESCRLAHAPCVIHMNAPWERCVQAPLHHGSITSDILKVLKPQLFKPTYHEVMLYAATYQRFLFDSIGTEHVTTNSCVGILR